MRRARTGIIAGGLASAVLGAGLLNGAAAGEAVPHCGLDFRGAPSAQPALPIAGGVVSGQWNGTVQYRVNVCDAHGLLRSQNVFLERVAPGVTVARADSGCSRGKGCFAASFAKLTLATVRRNFRRGDYAAWRLPDGTRVLASPQTLPFPTPGLAPAVDWTRERV